MKITHYSNSFISISTQGEQIVCDPWMGKANGGGWQSFPEYPVDLMARHLSNTRWVYLSHLHDDHFHPESLKDLGLLDKEFVIKRFQIPVMRDRLKRLGVARIHEFDPFTVNRLGPFDLSIFPQITNNSSGMDDEVNYDLDTSIAFKADGAVFFNQVDNPLSTADLSNLKNWIVANLGRIDIACLKSGAASEYPQLFLGIDQASEKQRIIRSSLDQLMVWLKLLDPTYYFPAGGTYLIPGPLSIFEHNIAQPSYKEISQLIDKLNLRVKPLAIEGGYSIEMLESDARLSANPEVKPIEKDRQVAIQMHRADTYAYEMLMAPPFEDLIEILNSARKKWLIKVESNSINITQSITFQIYKSLVTNLAVPDAGQLLGSYQLFQSRDTNSGELKIHIDHRALYGCLNRTLVWNGVLGSLCLYERMPNRYYPTDFSAINYL